MDYLQDIIKEIGEEFTTLASEITEVEQYVDTGSYIFNGLCSGSIFGGVSSNRILRSLPLLEKVALERLFSLSPLSRTSWILIPPLMCSILILRLALLGHF